jgi:ethanolamine transporter
MVDSASWLYAGLILGAMLGPTIVFTIPVALSMIDTEDHYYLAMGSLIGIIAIPFGCFTGGLAAMYSNISVEGEAVNFTYSLLFMNLIPVIIFSSAIAIALWLIPEQLIRGFQYFSKIIVSLITVGLVLAVLEATLGWQLLPAMDPVFMVTSDQPGKVIRAFEIVGHISCILLGAYPMIFLLSRWNSSRLSRLCVALKVNPYSATGLLATLANNILMFSLFKKMDPRGKIINVAFTVCAAFTFGDHLGFTAATFPQMIFPVVCGKLAGGILAIFLALRIIPLRLSRENQPNAFGDLQDKR